MRSKFLWLILITLMSDCFAQNDSSMKFDFGISRGNNTYLWPILRVRKAPGYKNTEIFFSIFQKKKDRNRFVKHAHLFPLYYYDSTKKHVELKIASLYYPSVFSYRNDIDDSIRSYKVGDLAPGISLMEATKSKDGLYIKNNAFFFLWFKKDLKKDKSYTVVFPIYWYFQHGPEKIQTLFPVYWSYRYKDIKNTILFPVVWNYKNKNFKSFTLFPLFSYGRSPDKKKSHLVATPLFWRFNDKENQRSGTVLFPVYYDFRTGAEKFQILFPVYWNYNYGDINNKVLFPLIWKFKNDYYKSFTFVPLVSFGQSPEKLESHLVITPFYWQFQDTNNLRQLLFPVYWHRKTHEIREINTKRGYVSYRHEEEVKKLFPIYSYVTSYSYTDSTFQRVIFPVYWRKKLTIYNRYYDSFPPRFYDNTTFFPVYYKRISDWGRTTVTFPLYFNNRRASDSALTIGITPLFWYHNSNTSTRYVFFPLYWNFHSKYKLNRTQDMEKINHTIFPVWYSRTYMGADTGKFRLLFPLVMTQTNWRGYNSLTIMPFYSKGYSNDGLKRHFAVTPIYWQFNSLYKKKIVVFPLYWYKNSYDLNISHTLFPIYFSHKWSGQKRQVLFPVVWFYKNESERKLTIFPLYYNYKWDGYNYKKGSDHRIVFFPLYWYSRSMNKDSIVKINHSLFPLVSAKRNFDRRGNLTMASLTVFPLYWSMEDRYDKYNVLFPLYFNYKDKTTGGYARAITPLYWEANKELYKLKMLIPFYLTLKLDSTSWRRSSTLVAITPLYWQRKDAIKTQTLYFPLLYKSEFANHDLKYSVLGLLYRQQITSTRNSLQVVWPLINFTTDTNLKYFHIVPLIWYKRSPHQDYFTIMPLFFVGKHNDIRRIQILWQIFSFRETPKKKTTGILFHAIHYDKYKNGDHAFRFIYLLFADINKNGNIEKSFFPFYYISRDTIGNKYFSTTFALYARSSKKIGQTSYFYNEERVLWILRLRSNYKYLKAKGAIKSRKDLRQI